MACICNTSQDRKCPVHDVPQIAAPSSAIRDAAYDQIDRFLRNNLDDTDYADYSQALDLIYTTAPTAGVGEVPRG